MQVKVKTLLNKTQPIPGFKYADVRLVEGPRGLELWGEIEAHRQRAGCCSVCERLAPTHDHLSRREWRHGGLWRIVTRLFYAPRSSTTITLTHQRQLHLRIG